MMVRCIVFLFIVKCTVIGGNSTESPNDSEEKLEYRHFTPQIPDHIVEKYYNQINVTTGPPPDSDELRNGYTKDEVVINRLQEMGNICNELIEWFALLENAVIESNVTQIEGVFQVFADDMRNIEDVLKRIIASRKLMHLGVEIANERTQNIEEKQSEGEIRINESL